ncbi:DUF917 family protein [uncultured Fibrobacter sp.]|uniref:S-methyl thiohydantoin desulfurase domain-containing protein n=1 Tax=uncultured Fibrobacter sp. TaxID=261512 RepID=UPI0025F1474E|nr:DUF917 family protein [uncultured Fibrobacter sp.]
MTNCGVEILPDELQNELQKIAYGACFLGSGGGGGLKTSFGYLDTYCTGDITGNLKITDLKEAKAGESGIVVAYMGAPQKVDTVKCPDAICKGIERFKEEMKGKDQNFKGIDYIIPIEIGAVSMVSACLTAHKLGKPVLDVDGAGRAVPTLDLITYTTNAHASVNPTFLCSENENKDPNKDPLYRQIKLEIFGDKKPDSDIPFDKDSDAASKMESLARPVLNMPEFDQKAGLVMWYFEDVTKLMDEHASVKGTLTLCRELGGIIQSEKGKNGAFPDIKKMFSEKLFSEKLFSDKSIYPFIKEICRGKLDSATTLTAGGFDAGVITIKGDSGHLYKIIFQNESLILWDSNSDKPLVMAPDLISYLIEDDEGQYVFSNGDIMDGDALKKDLHEKEIFVYGIAAPKVFLTPEMQRNIMRVLNALGYYGKIESFYG